jgi:hypothetical protein
VSGYTRTLQQSMRRALKPRQSLQSQRLVSKQAGPVDQARGRAPVAEPRDQEPAGSAAKQFAIQ